MKKPILFLALIILFHSASAYRMEWGRTVIISTPVYEDLYVAGGTITINAPIHGDLIVAGGTVYINDTVMNDLLIAGGTIYINGYVADDIRCAGGQLFIQNNIGEDLVITGGRVNVAKTAFINGALIAGGGEIIVNGTVNGDVRSAAGKFTFNGIANKNFECRSESLIMNGTVAGTSTLAAQNIAVLSGASFNNNVRYWNKSGELSFNGSLKKGTAVYDPSLKIETKNWYYLGHATVLGLVWYLVTVFLFILLIQALFGKTLKRVGGVVGTSMLKSLAWGLVFFIAVPVAIVLLLITIIGIPLGLLLIFSYVSLIVLATIITSLVSANWYNNRFQKNWGLWKIVLSAFGMFILLKIVTFTPFFGWLIMFAIACIAFGSILRNVNWRKRQANIALS